MMYPPIHTYCTELTKEFDAIPSQRKELLKKISDYLAAKQKAGSPAKLTYICTHNSRRSHFGQVWAEVASAFYGIKNISAFSGGTEVTTFNSNAINALKRVGFTIKPLNSEKNTHYQVIYDDLEKPINSFSKVYDDPANPQKEFAAVMTCREAENNCPFIPGAELTLGIPYDDPKSFKSTPQKNQKYDECCRQIALETLYAFSNVWKSTSLN